MKLPARQENYWLFVPQRPFTMYHMRARIRRLFSKGKPRWRPHNTENFMWRHRIGARKVHEAFFLRNRPIPFIDYPY